jgi:serine kinase of HPr protein (carbohydrate metabolism regulator)
MSAAAPVHASVALIGDRGVLIRGAPGSGKSSLLLSLVAQDPHTHALVADDRVALAAAHGRLLASVPESIAGLIEVRGQGIARRPWVSPVVIDLVVDLAPPEACPRMPLGEDEALAAVAGVDLPRVLIPVGAADAALRVTAALDRIGREKH